MSDTGTPERRYDEEEVGRLLKRATEIQTREAFAPLRNIARQTALLALLALLVALVLSVTLSRRLSRPISSLATASEQVAAGDLSTPQIRGGPGEIGRLARRFRGMVDSLARSREELEQSNQQLVQAEIPYGIGPRLAFHDDAKDEVVAGQVDVGRRRGR